MKKLRVEIEPQPTIVACGPTCLHAVYRYFGREISIATIVDEVNHKVVEGCFDGALGVHAICAGLSARIASVNLRVLDPSWFVGHGIREALVAAGNKTSELSLKNAALAYAAFVNAGGELALGGITFESIVNSISRSIPVIVGLSSTFLYRSRRSSITDGEETSVGHFVVVTGVDVKQRMVSIADPLSENPAGLGAYYDLPWDQLLSCICLGALTNDGAALIVWPPGWR